MDFCPFYNIIQHLIEISVQIIDCEKANVYILDEVNGEFWTKSLRVNEITKFPLNKGAASTVYLNN